MQINLQGLVCGEYIVWFVVGLWWVFLFKRNKNGKQESQKALNLYLFKVETPPQQDIMARCGGGGLPESLEIYVIRNTIPAKNIVKSFQNFSYKPFYC